jgi:hypothetical protein
MYCLTYQEGSPMRFSIRPLAGLLVLMTLAGPACSAPAAADKGYLRFLPSDTRVVVTLHVPALLEGKADWAGLGKRVYQAHLVSELKKVDRPAVRDVTSLVFAMPYAGGTDGLIVVRGKVDAKLLAEQVGECARLGKAVTVLPAGKGQPVPIYRRKIAEEALAELLPLPSDVPAQVRKLVAPQEVYFAAVDDETLILSVDTTLGKTQLLRALRARAPGARPRIPEELQKLLKKQDERDTLSLAMLDDALHPLLALLLPDSMKEPFEQWEYVTGRMRGGKEVELTVVVQAKTAELGGQLAANAERGTKLVAKALPTLAKDDKQKALLEELARSIQVRRKESVVTVTVRMSADKARELAAPPKE